MTGVLVLAGFGLVIVSLVLSARLLEAGRWRSQSVIYRVWFPRGVKVEQVVAWLGGLPVSSRLMPRSPIGFEVVGTATGIEHHLVVARSDAEGVSLQLQAAMPGVRLEAVEDPGEPAAVRGVELRGSSRVFPLAVDRAEMGSSALLASLSGLRRGESVRVQWLLSGAGAPPVPRRRSKGAGWNGSGLRPSEEVRGLRRKSAEPLLRGVVRVGVASSSPARRTQLLGRVRAAFSVMDAPGMRLTNSWWPSFLVVERMRLQLWPLLGWGISLNARELAGLLGVPVGEVELPGLVLGGSRQLAPGPGTFRSGVLVAESDHPMSEGRKLRLGTRDRLQHLHVIGPTGVGKSTLLANLALQDIADGRGVVVIDPKRDLVEAILRRVPERRITDVVVLDPVDLERPVGFNPLAGGSSVVAQELAAEHLLGVFRDLFAEAWGPRTDDVMRAGLRTLTATRAEDGSRFTICELPELLGDVRFRRFVLGQKSVPEALRGFWQWFDAVSDAERASVIAPALNKLRAFTTRTPIRLALGQSSGFDLMRVFTERKVLLVPLSAGELGRPSAQLLGALLVAALWQVTAARTRVPAERRHPVFVYLDEFQDVVRLPVPLGDMLAQARGLGVGLTLAHQYLEQLPREVRAGVLGTVRSSVAFQLGPEDARAMEARFAPAAGAQDLMGLPSWHVLMRAVDHGQVVRPVSGRTLGLEPPCLASGVISRLSRGTFGTSRADVETGLGRRLHGQSEQAPLGRKRRAS